MDFQKVVFRLFCLAWLGSKIISFKLWLGDRVFPIVPAFDFLPTAPPVFHNVVFGVSGICLMALLVFPMRLKLLYLLILSELISCSLDLTRWQPWEFFFLILSLIYSQADGKARTCGIVLLLGFGYVYSGFHKCNAGFLENVWNPMFLRRFSGLEPNTFLTRLGLTLPFLELLIGFGILFWPKKKMFAAAAMLMHLVLLIVLMSMHHNAVVWPWNVAMIGLNAGLFFTEGIGRIEWKNPVLATVVVFCGVLPMLSFFGKWDNYLSFDLYSGKKTRAVLCLSEANPAVAPCVGKDRDCAEASVVVKCLTFGELHVPPYPEHRFYRNLEKAWW